MFDVGRFSPCAPPAAIVAQPAINRAVVRSSRTMRFGNVSHIDCLIVFLSGPHRESIRPILILLRYTSVSLPFQLFGEVPWLQGKAFDEKLKWQTNRCI